MGGDDGVCRLAARAQHARREELLPGGRNPGRNRRRGATRPRRRRAGGDPGPRSCPLDRSLHRSGNVLRGFVAYGTILAGYTAAMVALLDTAHPDHVLALGTDRLLTVLTGVATAFNWSSPGPAEHGGRDRLAGAALLARLLHLMGLAREGAEHRTICRTRLVPTSAQWKEAECRGSALSMLRQPARHPP